MENPFEKYEGEWKDGFRHGQGTIVHQDPFGKYVGECKNGLRNGFGKSIWSEPHQEHEGEYKNNEKIDLGQKITRMGVNMLEILLITREMVKEHVVTQTETNMLENGRNHQFTEKVLGF